MEKKSSTAFLEIDWNNIHQELSQKGMTRKLLYEKILQSNPIMYSYSQFNRYYNKFIKTINPSMRQIHYGGDKLFIDYSGLTMPIVNQRTGEI
jgi:transposase